VEVKAPIKAGQVIIKDILDTGVNIIATKSIYQNYEYADYLKDHSILG
jgi:CxxC motif-containing protein